MHKLLKRGMPWIWDKNIDTEFRLARSILSTNQLELAAQPISPAMERMEPTEDVDHAHRSYTDMNRSPTPADVQADWDGPRSPTPSHKR